MNALPFVIPVPYLANELGWIGAEIGRQPWLIYGLMRTSEASTTTLPVWQLALTISGVFLVYIAIVFGTLGFIRTLIGKGPQSTTGEA